jgi:hypothetical protein
MYRIVNLDKTEFTWSSHNGKAKTRIDTLLTHKDIQVIITNLDHQY